MTFCKVVFNMIFSCYFLSPVFVVTLFASIRFSRV